jgi:hypothetical protein
MAVRNLSDRYPECGGMGTMHITLDVLKPPIGERRLFFRNKGAFIKKCRRKQVVVGVIRTFPRLLCVKVVLNFYNSKIYDNILFQIQYTRKTYKGRKRKRHLLHNLPIPYIKSKSVRSGSVNLWVATYSKWDRRVMKDYSKQRFVHAQLMESQ